MRPMDRETEMRFQNAAAQMASLTFLVEMLYVFHFKSLPDQTAFAAFSAELKQKLQTATVEGADPALADHASASVAEATFPILDRIAARIADKHFRAIQPKQDPPR